MKYKGRGSNPSSLANLKREGRPLIVGEPKKIRSLSVSDTGWENLKAIALSLGMSTSDLVEKIGREEIKLLIPEPNSNELDTTCEVV